MDREKFLRAFECIIKDTESKYDECIVERILTHCELKLQDMYLDVFKLIKPYTDNKDLATFNPTRTFKIFKCFLNPICTREQNSNFLIPYLDSLWNTLDVIWAQKDSSAIRVLLVIFDELILFPPTLCVSYFSWLLDKVIEPPLSNPESPGLVVNDILSLIKAVVMTNTNYHTRNMAEKLFQDIIYATLMRHPHPKIPIIKHNIKELMIETSMMNLSRMLDSLFCRNREEIFRYNFCVVYGIADMLRDRFSELVEQPNANINTLCKCLAMLDSSKYLESRLNKLKLKNNLEAIAFYIANTDFKATEFEQLLLIYLLYPLLTKCSGDDTQVLIQRIMITRDERNFIDRNINCKFITLTLALLKGIYQKIKQGSAESSTIISPRTSVLIVQILTNFIRQNYNLTTSYKNVMQCCEILYLIWSQVYFYVEKEFDDLLSAMTAIQEITDQTRPIVVKLIKVLRRPIRNYSLYNKVINLAFNFSDHDIINDFVELFKANEFNFSLATESEVRSYVKLVWQHMYLNVRDTDHRELLGNLAHLLIMIDLEIPVKILDEFNIRRHHDVPRLIGDILKERASIHPTVELIIEVLAPKYLNCDQSDAEYPDRTRGYLSRLDSPTLASTVRKNLDNLVEGICAAVKGEANDGGRHIALCLITRLVEEIVINCDDTNSIVERLVGNKILETLHEVSVGHLHTSKMIKKARKCIHLLANNAQLNQKGDIMYEKLKLIGKDDEEAKKIVKTYLGGPDQNLMDSEESLRKHDQILTENTITVSSLVESILVYDLTAEKISDCY